MISFVLNRKGFDVDLRRELDRARRPQAVMSAVGRELVNQLKTHFREKDKNEPNKLSPRREHFWLQVMRSVNAPVLRGPASVQVTISDPRMAHKVFGGPIVAKRAKALTIPVEERAYGRTVSTFERETGLKLFLVKKGEDPGGRGGVLAVRAEGGGLTVEYILAKRVRQDKDPTALPEEAMLQAALVNRARKVAERQNNEGQK